MGYRIRRVRPLPGWFRGMRRATLGCGLLLCAGLLVGQEGVPANTAGWPKNFSVVSIKPVNSVQPGEWRGQRPEAGGRYRAVAPADTLIEFALNVRRSQIEGLPKWAKDTLYAIDAVPPPGAPALPGRQNIEMERPMVQAMLEQRFHLRFHRLEKPMAVLELVIAQGGPKLAEASQEEVATTEAPGAASRAHVSMVAGRMGCKITSEAGQLTSLVNDLSDELQETIIDKTGLTGYYDYTLAWMPGPGETAPTFGSPVAPTGASIYGALESQLGLRLKPGRAPVPVVAIDHIEQPSGN